MYPIILFPKRLWKMSTKRRSSYLRSWYFSLPSWQSQLLQASQYFSVWSIVIFLIWHWKWKTWIDQRWDRKWEGGYENDVFFMYPCMVRRFSVMVSWNVLCCSIGGAYMAWISPRYIYISYLHTYLDSQDMKWMDLFGHQIFFLWTILSLLPYQKIHYLPFWSFSDLLEKGMDLCFVHLIPSIYLLYLYYGNSRTITQQYNISFHDLVRILGITEVVFFLFWSCV